MMLAYVLDTAAPLVQLAVDVAGTTPPEPPITNTGTGGTPMPTDPISSLLAPGGALTLILGTIWFSAREFRKGREMRVKDAEDSEEQERLRRTAAEADRDRVTGELRSKLADVEHQLVQLREEMRTTLEAQEERHRREMRAQEERHRTELADSRGREEQANAENWRLRTLLTRRGYDPDTGELIGEHLADDEHGRMEVDTATPVPRLRTDPLPDDDDEGMGP